ncbi:MAG TPA: hypothetical protein VFM90_10580, partial [Cyclobacteriaceae bacterium]|nr:hypothetical protein [Cyclobacteriaceae bacterium]
MVISVGIEDVILSQAKIELKFTHFVSSQVFGVKYTAYFVLVRLPEKVRRQFQYTWVKFLPDFIV